MACEREMAAYDGPGDLVVNVVLEVSPDALPDEPLEVLVKVLPKVPAPTVNHWPLLVPI